MKQDLQNHAIFCVTQKFVQTVKPKLNAQAIGFSHRSLCLSVLSFLEAGLGSKLVGSNTSQGSVESTHTLTLAVMEVSVSLPSIWLMGITAKVKPYSNTAAVITMGAQHVTLCVKKRVCHW